MTNQPHDLRELRFDESVRVAGWVIGVLGLVLGVTAGVLTGVAVRNLAGDDPIISGSDAIFFYVTFAIAILVDLFLLVNFTNLSVTVADRGFEFRYGIFGKLFSWDQISNVKATDYRWITYGGWGIRFSTKGRRAWSQLGVKRGVVIEVDESGRSRRYFVSSRRADELAKVLSRGIGDAASLHEDDNATPEPGTDPA
jgi:hypothetical protein